MTITRTGQTVTVTGDWRVEPDVRRYRTESEAREAEARLRRAAARLDAVHGHEDDRPS